MDTIKSLAAAISHLATSLEAGVRSLPMPQDTTTVAGQIHRAMWIWMYCVLGSAVFLLSVVPEYRAGVRKVLASIYEHRTYPFLVLVLLAVLANSLVDMLEARYYMNGQMDG